MMSSLLSPQLSLPGSPLLLPVENILQRLIPLSAKQFDAMKVSSKACKLARNADTLLLRGKAEKILQYPLSQKLAWCAEDLSLWTVSTSIYLRTTIVRLGPTT